VIRLSSSPRTEFWLDVDYAGDELAIGFNSRYLLDAIGPIENEQIVVEFKDSLERARSRGHRGGAATGAQGRDNAGVNFAARGDLQVIGMPPARFPTRGPGVPNSLTISASFRAETVMAPLAHDASRVKAQVRCPESTEVRCPLFTDVHVRRLTPRLLPPRGRRPICPCAPAGPLPLLA
jgi:hypothetical protein